MAETDSFLFVLSWPATLLLATNKGSSCFFSTLQLERFRPRVNLVVTVGILTDTASALVAYMRDVNDIWRSDILQVSGAVCFSASIEFGLGKMLGATGHDVHTYLAVF